jgi:molybdopterin molybdotransferase
MPDAKLFGMPDVLTFADARHVVEQHARALRGGDPEPVELLAGRGRVLAQEIVADRDFPPFPRATRDGYAVRSADIAKPAVRLRVVGELRAGADPGSQSFDEWQPGTAVEIMTGAPAPPGADAVVMVEHTFRHGDFVEIQRSAVAGENVVPAGSEAKRGEALLPAGRRMDATSIAVAASVGFTTLRVHQRPRVAILSTGDEIVDIAAEPGPSQIRNSNSYSVAAQVAEAGGEPVQLPIAPDEPEQLRHLVAEGLTADLLLLTGGVSAGKYDLVEQVLGRFHAEFFFTGALIQPGKPIVFGRALARDGAKPTYFFGLPGNPVSTMVTFELFARPVIEALSGAEPTTLKFLQARLGAEIKTKTGLTRFLPGVLSGEFESAVVQLAAWKGSGDVVGTARANCWVVVPPERDSIPAGEWIAVMPR